MVANYSMPGFDIRYSDGILELRTDGERTEDNGIDTERAFTSLLRHCQPQALLFDVRGADYTLAPSRWRERVRAVARITKEYPLAIVYRDVQVEQQAQTIEAHRSLGGCSEAFTSRRDAKAWLIERLAERSAAQ